MITNEKWIFALKFVFFVEKYSIHNKVGSLFKILNFETTIKKSWQNFVEDSGINLKIWT